MKIAFISEMNFSGKIPSNHPNMRVEFAWMHALGATHFNINQEINDTFDLALILTPKKHPEYVNFEKIKKTCKKIGLLQEGPCWLYQDYDIKTQVNFYNNLLKCDILFAHNNFDKKYFEALTDHKDIRTIQSLMIEDAVNKNFLISKENRKNVIIGGNFVSWYGGFDSFIVAKEIDEHIYAPSMGRKQDGEENLVINLPYMNWTDWITALSNFKYAVHLMRTHAAGTFALNCAYLGIPCIGYKGLDTQELCHPDLSVNIGDLKTAKKLILDLKNDNEFYNYCSSKTLKNYKLFNKENFLKSFN
jgi:hypothetical protein